MRQLYCRPSRLIVIHWTGCKAAGVPSDQSVPGPFHKGTWADTKPAKVVTVTGINVGKDVYNGTGNIQEDDHTIPEDHNVVPDQHYGERNKDTITHDRQWIGKQTGSK